MKYICLIKHIKSVLWRVVKRLSYIQDARCLKVKDSPRQQWLRERVPVLRLYIHILPRLRIKLEAAIAQLV